MVKINIAKSSGFCFGVRRAIKIALDTSQSDAMVEILGYIVYNEDVLREINKAWIKKLDVLEKVAIKHF